MNTKTIAAAAKLTLLTALCAPLGMGSALAQDNEVAEQDQTMLDVRFITAKYAMTNNIDMSRASYLLAGGSDALGLIAEYYQGSELWSGPILTYAQTALSRTDAVAIIVEHKDAAPMVIVPWDRNDPPAFAQLPSQLAYTELGFIIPLDEGFVSQAAECDNSGSYGDYGEGVTCACIPDLGCKTCTTCNEPDFDANHFRANACKSDSMSMFNFEVGHTLPVYCF